MRSVADVLVAEGLVSAQDAAAATGRAARAGWPLVKVLVDEKLVSETDLAEALGRALDLPVVDLVGGELDEEAIRLVPEELASRRTVIPMGLDVGTRILRLAVADPLDQEALRDVERSTGMAIAPMVATLSSIDRAIARYYARTSTKVVARGSRSTTAAPPEDTAESEPDRPFSEATRKVPPRAAEGTSPGTVPRYSIEEEASLETRFSALLLALEERGALTHTQYVETLRRLLGVS